MELADSIGEFNRQIDAIKADVYLFKLRDLLDKESDYGLECKQCLKSQECLKWWDKNAYPGVKMSKEKYQELVKELLPQ